MKIALIEIAAPLPAGAIWNGTLVQALRHLDLRRYVFTNTSRADTTRLLRQLGIEGLFAGIFDPDRLGGWFKPAPMAYHKVLATLDVPASECVLLDNSVANCRAAAEAGMRPVLIAGGLPPGETPGDLPCAADLQQACDQLAALTRAESGRGRRPPWLRRSIW